MATRVRSAYNVNYRWQEIRTLFKNNDQNQKSFQKNLQIFKIKSHHLSIQNFEKSNKTPNFIYKGEKTLNSRLAYLIVCLDKMKSVNLLIVVVTNFSRQKLPNYRKL